LSTKPSNSSPCPRAGFGGGLRPSRPKPWLRARLCRRRRPWTRPSQGALQVEETEDRAAGSADGKHAADGGDDAGTPKGAGGGGFFGAGLGELALGGFLGLARPGRTSRLDFTTPQSTSRVSSRRADVEPFLDAEETTGDEGTSSAGAAAPRISWARSEGDVFAVTGIGEQLVLDEMTHRRGSIGECALEELDEDGLARAVEQRCARSWWRRRPGGGG